MTEGKPKTPRRRRPIAHLTISERVKEAATRYKLHSGKSLSALADDVLSEFLEKKGYLSTHNPAGRLAEEPPAYGKTKKIKKP
jgi:hypothetical protein